MTSRLELVLYVSEHSVASLRARTVMDRLLRRYDPAHVRYVVRDIAEEPDAAERDRIVFTPTLVKVSPAPMVWILGDLTRDWLVVDLLAAAGVNPVEQAR